MLLWYLMDCRSSVVCSIVKSISVTISYLNQEAVSKIM